MKKNIVIVALLSVITGSMYGDEDQTWSEWFNEKVQSFNQKVNPYQYHKIETYTTGAPRSESHYGFKSRGINPVYYRSNITPEGVLEMRSFELPVRGMVATGAIAGGAYLAGRWAWNRFMTPEFKKIETKITHASKANTDLQTQITNALNNKKAADADQKVLEMYEIATKECQKIYAGMKNDVEQHRKGAERK